jgi:hypothetical protein
MNTGGLGRNRKSPCSPRHYSLSAIVLLAGYTLGYTKLAGGGLGIAASHRRQSAANRHYPEFVAVRQAARSRLANSSAICSRTGRRQFAEIRKQQCSFDRRRRVSGIGSAGVRRSARRSRQRIPECRAQGAPRCNRWGLPNTEKREHHRRKHSPNGKVL